MPADVSSGRSLVATLSSTHSDRPGFAAASMLVTDADPPSPDASNVDVRMVATLMASTDFTV